MPQDTTDQVKQQLIELAPWHMDIALPGGLRTVAGNRDQYQDPDFKEISVIGTHSVQEYIDAMYPDGLADRSLLDVGCNAGGYCFMANDLGAEFAYGFDVREHWIRQARFVAKLKELTEEQIDFGVHHVEELPTDRKFDITIFKGVFYHLPDPIAAIKRLSEVTSDTIIIDTATRSDIPEDCMMVANESTTHVMSGVDRLCWYPGGPMVLRKLLEWSGFEHFRTINWIRDNRPTEQRPSARKLAHHGRVCIAASRNEEPIERLVGSFEEPTER